MSFSFLLVIWCFNVVVGRGRGVSRSMGNEADGCGLVRMGWVGRMEAAKGS